MSEAAVSLPATPATGEAGNTRSITLSILWAILTLGIYTFFWAYRTQDETRRYSGQGLGGPVGLVLYIVTIVAGYVAVAITGVVVASEAQRLYERDHRTPPFSGLWGLWLLLPIVGAFVWFIPVQRALNDFWQSKGAPAS
jgi:uncharacterized membrane protein YjjB (DUF3815 family)